MVLHGTSDAQAVARLILHITNEDCSSSHLLGVETRGPI